MTDKQAIFSVLILTANPNGQTGDAGGAFVKIDGREAVVRSIELFLNRENVKQIQVAFLPEMAEEAKKRHGAHLSFSGVKVLTGGPGWLDQIASARGKIAGEATHVIVHDAARPAVAYTDIEALMEEAGQTKKAAVVLASPARDGLIELDAPGKAGRFHVADRFMNVLTPQLFTAKRFEQMASEKKGPEAGEIGILKGSGLNVRCSGPGDERLVKTMIGLLPKAKAKPASSPFEEAQW